MQIQGGDNMVDIIENDTQQYYEFMLFMQEDKKARDEVRNERLQK